MLVPWVQPASLGAGSMAVNLTVLTLGHQRGEESPMGPALPQESLFPISLSFFSQKLFSYFYPKRVRHGKGLYPILRSKSKHLTI